MASWWAKVGGRATRRMRLGRAALGHDLAERLVDPVEALGHDRQKVAARLGQHELLRTPLEQGDAQEFLQHDDVAADRALGHRQAVRPRP